MQRISVPNLSWGKNGIVNFVFNYNVSHKNSTINFSLVPYNYTDYPDYYSNYVGYINQRDYLLCDVEYLHRFNLFDGLLLPLSIGVGVTYKYGTDYYTKEIINWGNYSEVIGGTSFVDNYGAILSAKLSLVTFKNFKLDIFSSYRIYTTKDNLFALGTSLAATIKDSTNFIVNFYSGIGIGVGKDDKSDLEKFIVPPIMLGFDVRKQGSWKVGFGPSFGFYKVHAFIIDNAVETNVDHSHYIIMMRGYLNVISSSYLECYTLASYSFEHIYQAYSTTNSNLNETFENNQRTFRYTPGISIGLRSYFLKNVGLFAEIGYSNYLISFGVIYKI